MGGGGCCKKQKYMYSEDIPALCYDGDDDNEGASRGLAAQMVMVMMMISCSLIFP